MENSLFLYRDCDHLRSEFLKLSSPNDVADLLDVTYPRLVYHLYKVSKDEKYQEFFVPKKTGGSRKISAPSSALKIIQRKLSQVLYSVYRVKEPAHGFVPNRSVLTNARQHVRKKNVLNLDLKSFFDSIHFGRVRGIFMASPYGLPPKVATVLAQICCIDNKLPQGAPTSPIVSNMICARLDSQLWHLAKDSRCRYTRYADDITFSTTLKEFPQNIVIGKEKESSSRILLGEELLSIIYGNDFEINWKKVRLQQRNTRQEVTGIVVNQFPNVRRSFVREISSMLYKWEKFGLLSVSQRYMAKRAVELSIPEEEVPGFKDVLRGKINYLGMVRGKEDSIYLKFLIWYKELSRKELESTVQG